MARGRRKRTRTNRYGRDEHVEEFRSRDQMMDENVDEDGDGNGARMESNLDDESNDNNAIEEANLDDEAVPDSDSGEGFSLCPDYDNAQVPQEAASQTSENEKGYSIIDQIIEETEGGESDRKSPLGNYFAPPTNQGGASDKSNIIFDASVEVNEYDYPRSMEDHLKATLLSYVNSQKPMKNNNTDIVMLFGVNGSNPFPFGFDKDDYIKLQEKGITKEDWSIESLFTAIGQISEDQKDKPMTKREKLFGEVRGRLKCPCKDCHHQTQWPADAMKLFFLDNDKSGSEKFAADEEIPTIQDIWASNIMLPANFEKRGQKKNTLKNIQRNLRKHFLSMWHDQGHRDSIMRMTIFDLQIKKAECSLARYNEAYFIQQCKLATRLEFKIETDEKKITTSMKQNELGSIIIKDQHNDKLKWCHWLKELRKKLESNSITQEAMPYAQETLKTFNIGYTVPENVCTLCGAEGSVTCPDKNTMAARTMIKCATCAKIICRECVRRAEMSNVYGRYDDYNSGNNLLWRQRARCPHCRTEGMFDDGSMPPLEGRTDLKVMHQWFVSMVSGIVRETNELLRLRRDIERYVDDTMTELKKKKPNECNIDRNYRYYEQKIEAYNKRMPCEINTKMDCAKETFFEGIMNVIHNYNGHNSTDGEKKWWKDIFQSKKKLDIMTTTWSREPWTRHPPFPMEYRPSTNNDAEARGNGLVVDLT